MFSTPWGLKKRGQLLRTCQRSEPATPSENTRQAIKNSRHAVKASRQAKKQQKRQTKTPKHSKQKPTKQFLSPTSNRLPSTPFVKTMFRGVAIARDGRLDRFFLKRHPNKNQIIYTTSPRIRSAHCSGCRADLWAWCRPLAVPCTSTLYQRWRQVILC